ncbi:MAG TPA: protoporphyrinogen oxidase HemJ [Gammaproteobacteria bacterium]|nr:protoporphyrinogen oxidase HemJ [Gammaproteobacteria bacterium]
MLWVKAFHIIFMVTWFSGLFYLPRLFVYHAETLDLISLERFKTMENKLFYMITTPGAILTILLGLWVMSFNFSGYLQSQWLHVKLVLVILLIFYHLYLGKLLHDFKKNRNKHTAVFYRWLNEVPAIFLVMIVILAVVKPLF